MDADSAWLELALRLEATAKHFRSGNPGTFLMDSQVEEMIAKGRAYNVRSVPLRKDEWPSADAVADLANRTNLARTKVAEVWSSLEDQDKIGLQPPNSHNL